MKTPLESAVQGAETAPSLLSAAKRPSVLGEGTFCGLEATHQRSSPGVATARLLMPLTPTAALRHQQKAIKPFGYSTKAAGARRSAWRPVIACIAGSPATTTPPHTKRASLLVTVPCTSDLAAIEIA